MKKQIILVLMMFYVGILYSASIQIISPKSGDKLVIDNNLDIKWHAMGLTKGIKITLWRNNSLIGIIVPNINTMPNTFRWKVGSFIGGTVAIGNG